MSNPPVIITASEEFYAKAAWSLLRQPGGEQLVRFARQQPSRWLRLFSSVDHAGACPNVGEFLALTSRGGLWKRLLDAEAAEAFRVLVVRPMSVANTAWHEGAEAEHLSFKEMFRYVFEIVKHLKAGEEEFFLDLPDGSRIGFKVGEKPVVLSAHQALAAQLSAVAGAPQGQFSSQPPAWKRPNGGVR